MVKDVSGYLSEQQRKSQGEVAAEWTSIEELYNKKLWHQLTLKLQQFVKHSSFSQGDGLIKMYQNFISDFEHRINPLALAEIIVCVVQQMKDFNEALEFLEKIRDKVKGNPEASVLCLTAIGNIQLRVNDQAAAKKTIEEAERVLDTIDGVTPVHSAFYELSSNFHKLKFNYAEYYRDVLRYFGCTDITTIPASTLKERVFNVGLAAILAKGVYNFGELLAHPALDVLRNTEHQWLVDLLFAFNSGNIGELDALQTQWKQQPDLANKEQFIREKISLLCLMEMAFRRPATKRQLLFSEIAAEARIGEELVELLVMKALSNGLIRGHIDQVEQRVTVDWIQPRVLDQKQIAVMKEKIAAWCKEVSGMEKTIEKKAEDIIAT